MAVDVHTHLLPERLAAKIRGYFATYMDASELSYTLDYEQLIESHLESGFDTVWNLPYAHKAGMAAALNESMLEVSAMLEGRGMSIVTGCTVHPGDPNTGEDVRTAVDNGARMLKLHCSVGNYEPTDPSLAPALVAAGELGIPVTIHAGHAISGYTEPSELLPVADAVADHPDTTFILAHSGHHAYAEAMELMRRLPNLHADLTPVIYEPVPLTPTDAEELSDRILFGSDAPNTGMRATELLDRLRSTGLSDAAFERITGANARRLIRP